MFTKIHSYLVEHPDASLLDLTSVITTTHSTVTTLMQKHKNSKPMLK